MSTNQPLSLFISSKMIELQKERDAVQKAFAMYHMDGWLWEHDAGARPEPIQSTYLNEVAACDIYLGLFWNGYGEYTIEEFRHARKFHKPCLIYVKQVDIKQRDQRLIEFLDEIHSVPDGLTAYHFKYAKDLVKQVQKDVMRLLTSRFRDIRSQPIGNIPFPRKHFFIGRETLLKRLYAQLQTQHTATLNQRQARKASSSQRQAISGLGGIGKTQLAVEYAYRHQYDYHAILWARADTVQALNASYTEFAILLQLPQKDHQEQEEITLAVKDWLSQNQNWLLILDNADEPEILLLFLPPKIGGHLIVTTRAADLSHLSMGFGHSLTVQKFTKREDVPFLLHRAGLKTVSLQEREYARRIADELDGLPLALNQAGVYLARTGCSLETYWEIYQQQRTILLNIQEEQDRAVAATLQLSFERVKQRSAAAADLLCLCAFLAPDAIPEEIFKAGASELGEVLAPVAADPHLLNQAFATLRAYSLLTRAPQSKTLTVHRLVQIVLRDMVPAEMHAEWIKRTILAIHTTLSGIEFEDWSVYERLLPHMLICFTWIEHGATPTLAAAHIFRKAGIYLRERGQYSEAKPLLEKALAIREQLLGPEHPDTAGSLNNLAALLWQQGHSEQAEIFYLRALAIRKQQLGLQHPDTAAVLSNLSLLYWQQKKYEQAELLAQQALTIRKALFGINHPDIAISMNNLANLYDDQEKYKQAEQLYLQALTIRVQLSGPESSSIAEILNNLAEFYQRQRKYEQAELFYQRALAIFKHLLGAEHPHTAHPLHGLAELYRQQGKHEQAENFYQQALAIREQLGPTHPELLETRKAYAVFLHSRGRSIEAAAFDPEYQSSIDNDHRQ